MDQPDSTRRRRFLQLSAALGGAFAACTKKEAAPAADDQGGPSRLGRPVRAYGDRSPFEKAERWMRQLKHPEVGSTSTPHAELHGILTPSALHFERHHAGVPQIDPARHTLTVHGLVERPLVFTLADLKRLPSVSRIYFLECGGNSGGEWSGKGAATVHQSHGLASCSEWTGVPLRLLLEEAGIKKEAHWVLAEGADACRMYRSLPVKKALDDILVAYGQNGEAIRPEQGYPLRLVVPGWEGNVSVKWLHRIEAVREPHQARDETSHYTDLMPDGKSRQFTFEMDAKSVITDPSGGQKLPGRGFHEVRGIAWSGRGRIAKVEVSTDGGGSWKPAVLDEPRLPMAFTRFRHPWNWDGRETTLLSRATDETSYLQPSRAELIAARGKFSQYHHNGIKPWKVLADGSVQNVES